MLEPGKAEVRPKRVEQGKGANRLEDEVPGPVRHLVADMDEVRRREPAAELRGRNALKVEVSAVEDIWIGDFAGR